MKHIGFIGCGNMGQAILSGILAKGLVPAGNIFIFDLYREKREALAARFGICPCENNREVVEKVDILFLAIKPQFYPEVIEEIRDFVRPEQLLISLAPGKTLGWLKEQFCGDAAAPLKIARIMPNTPAMVGEGMTAFCPAPDLSEEEKSEILTLLQSFSRTELLEERLMDAFVSVCGSSPAWLYMVIEAMADGAVADGIPREKAYKFAAQAMLGSAKMVLETGKHPAELKDAVCSPGGTTIEGVRVLESKGLRSAFMEAMKACSEKSRKM